MQRDLRSRRSVLSLATGIAAAGVGTAAVQGRTDESVEGELTRDSFSIMDGTPEETTVYVTESSIDGPTVLVLGGVHGNEVAGYVAAAEISDWTIEAGTLVTIPEANAVAVERETRVGDDGDLNRQFPVSSEPETDLARTIWGVVTDYDPEVVIDLHESRGIYAGDPVDGVGQAIFHSRNHDAAAAAGDATEYVNHNYVDDPDLAFQTAPLSGPDTDPTGLLVHKATRDLNADAFLAETLSTGVDLETRVSWHSMLVERLVADQLFPEDDPENGHEPDDDLDEPDENGEPDEGDEPDENGEPDEDGDESDADEDESGEDPADDPDGETDHTSPVADIRTIPDGAAETSLESETTVELDASPSCGQDGEIVAYEWCIHNDDVYDETGETIEVTVSASGEHPVELRVVDDSDAVDTEEIVLTVD